MIVLGMEWLCHSEANLQTEVGLHMDKKRSEAIHVLGAKDIEVPVFLIIVKTRRKKVIKNDVHVSVIKTTISSYRY